MIGDAPSFWWVAQDWRRHLFWPFAAVYGHVAGRRMEQANPPSVDAAVLCIGNYTVGGSGKTPTVIALAARARKLGLNPAVLTRGYGGSLTGPHLVDLDHDIARSVGDEALLIARAAPVMVAADRLAGARLLVERGHRLIIMDDGFQSMRLRFDRALIVVDAARGLGNGAVIPAGPVRAPLKTQLRLTDALLVMGEGDAADSVIRLAARAAKPVMTARLKPANTRSVRGRKLLAFAGIGHPDRFFRMLGELGATVARTRPFPDHHMFTDDDLAALMREADANGLELVTTDKDFVRLTGTGDLRRTVQERTITLPVKAEWADPNLMDLMLSRTMDAYHKRAMDLSADSAPD